MDQSAAEHLTQPSSQLLTSQLLTSQLKQTRPWKSAAGAYSPLVLARASLLGGQRSPGPPREGGGRRITQETRTRPRAGVHVTRTSRYGYENHFQRTIFAVIQSDHRSPQEAASTTGLCACSPPGMCSLCRHSASPSAILVFAPFAGAVCRR